MNAKQESTTATKTLHAQIPMALIDANAIRGMKETENPAQLLMNAARERINVI
jgi:hypothetical protein